MRAARRRTPHGVRDCWSSRRQDMAKPRASRSFTVPRSLATPSSADCTSRARSCSRWPMLISFARLGAGGHGLTLLTRPGCHHSRFSPLAPRPRKVPRRLRLHGWQVREAEPFCHRGVQLEYRQGVRPSLLPPFLRPLRGASHLQGGCTAGSTSTAFTLGGRHRARRACLERT